MLTGISGTNNEKTMVGLVTLVYLQVLIYIYMILKI